MKIQKTGFMDFFFKNDIFKNAIQFWKNVNISRKFNKFI